MDIDADDPCWKDITCNDGGVDGELAVKLVWILFKGPLTHWLSWEDSALSFYQFYATGYVQLGIYDLRSNDSSNLINLSYQLMQ